jgi:hypothetical protein
MLLKSSICACITLNVPTFQRSGHATPENCLSWLKGKKRELQEDAVQSQARTGREKRKAGKLYNGYEEEYNIGVSEAKKDGSSKSTKSKGRGDR